MHAGALASRADRDIKAANVFSVVVMRAVKAVIAGSVALAMSAFGAAKTVSFVYVSSALGAGYVCHIYISFLLNYMCFNKAFSYGR